MTGSKVIDGDASAMTRGEMPCAMASFLKASSHLSKLPVLRQCEASAGVARQSGEQRDRRRSFGGACASAALHALDQLDGRPRVGRHLVFELRLGHRLAGAVAEPAVDVADIVALLLQQALQFHHLFGGQRLHLGRAGFIDRRRAAEPRGEIGDGGGVDVRRIPVDEDLEVRIGEEGRAVPAHRQDQRRLHRAGRQLAMRRP